MNARIWSLGCVLSLAALGIFGCGGTTKTVTVAGPPKSVINAPATTSTHTKSSKTSTAAAAAPATVVHLSAFQTPSGNIGCELLDGVARCDIGKRTWSPPARPASCPNIVDFGQGLEVSGSAPARFVCAGDTASDPASPKLAYGSGSEVGGFLCVSEQNGLTCTDHASAHGFFISIQSYRIF
jgi:hypothetical protein